MTRTSRFLPGFFGRTTSIHPSSSRLAPRKPRQRLPLFETLEERTVLSVSVASSFNALYFNSSGGYVPPDTNGAVGASKYVETVNQEVGLYDKSTGGLISKTSLSSFYFTTGGYWPRVETDCFNLQPKEQSSHASICRIYRISLWRSAN